ncbi:MAG: sensor domain-containing protein [Anaerolineae bacterium]|nr:sensor domain-containing protein [Anaerolineae bacterium]
MSAVVQEKPDIYERFFGVIAQGQTYLNVVYLLLSFPLGLFYFIFLIVGLSVGTSLVIIWVGIPILLVVLTVWWGMLVFEREMTNHLLPIDIPPLARDPNPPEGMWARIKATLTNPVTWKGLVYLLARFPLGILAFVVVVTWFALTLGLISAPFVYSYGSFAIEGSAGTMNEALLCAVVGVVIGFAGMHLMNLLAYVFGQFAILMLGMPQKTAPSSTVEQK